MKMLERIQREHDDVRALFLTIDNNEERQGSIFSDLAVEILAHHEAEEEVVFSKLPASDDAEALKLELIAEHDTIRRQIQVVLDTDSEDDNWKARYSVLKELFSHHMEEEENELFDVLREDVSPQVIGSMPRSFETARTKHKADAEQMVKDRMVLTPELSLPKSQKA